MKKWQMYLRLFFMSIMVFYIVVSSSYVLQVEVPAKYEPARMQLFWTNDTDFQEKLSTKSSINNNEIRLTYSDPFFRIKNFRLDPDTGELAIRKITIKNKYFPVGEIVIKGTELANSFSAVNCSLQYGMDTGILLVMPDNNDPQLIGTAHFRQLYEAQRLTMHVNLLLWAGACVLLAVGFSVLLYFLWQKYSFYIKTRIVGENILLGQKVVACRWLLGVMLLVVCVFFEIHGSSIGLYANILGYPDSNIVIFGENRPIRSDEWLVFTPFAFSQYFTGFSYISDIVRGMSTDMFMVYGQPVWDIGMIFRPTQWGYLFFKPGTGLSFFWMSRWIFLFLVSFEFGRLLTNDKKAMSFAYAMMVAFAPVVQWWFSINSFVEMLIFGQGAILLWKRYLLSDQIKFRIIYIVGILWCAGVYLFSLYPVWQVPFAYIFFILFMWVGMQHKKQFLRRKKDLIFWTMGLILFAIPVIHVFQNSWYTIELIKNTEYPGSRQTTGGSLRISDLFVYGNSLFLPFYDVTEGSNNCEAASFFCLAPVGWLFFLWQNFHRKKDGLLIMLAVLNIVFIFWAIMGMPLWLSQLLLLARTTENRIASAIGFLDLLILFRALALIDFKEIFFIRISLIVAAVMAIFVIYCSNVALPNWLSLKMAAIEFMVLFYLFSVLLKGKIFSFIKWISLVMLVIGMTVNPISHGTASVYTNPIGEKISSIVKLDKGLWLVEGEMREVEDYPIMFGAPTINSVNVYPALERWGELSSALADAKIYNRYAHIMVNVTGREKTTFLLKQGDLVQIDLTVHDLKTLQVKYIFTRNKLNDLQTAEVRFTELFSEHGFYIYQVDYR